MGAAGYALTRTLSTVSNGQGDLGVNRVVIVLKASAANRQAMREAADMIAADFPLGTRTVLAALAEGRDPGANGVVVL